MLAKARMDNLLVTELGRELVVYDQDRHRAHRLNPSAAFVFRHADGRTTVPDMAALLAKDLGIPESDEVVWLALDRLERAHLLTQPVNRAATVTRRQVMKRLAAVGVGIIPVVSSITAPTPTMAQSPAPCGQVGEPCNTTADCCPGLDCNMGPGICQVD